MTTVSGPVTDTQGNAVAGASVTVKYKRPIVGYDGGAVVENVRQFTTDGSGNLSMADLVPGHYDITIAIVANDNTSLTVLQSGTLTVLDQATQTIESAITDTVGIITPSILQQAIDAKDAAQTALDEFDDRYLGAKASDPATDNDGDALLVGAVYWNSTSDEWRAWSGSVWLPLTGADKLLSNLSNTATARTNLGLGDLATQNTVNNTDWSGDDLAVVNGGTGASTASAARTNLGLGNAATKGVTGADANAVTGTAGTSGNLAQWNVDGDAVDALIAASAVITDSDTQSTATWEAGTSTTEGLVSPAKVKSAIDAKTTASVDDDGTQSSGTYTPSAATGSNYKKIVNGGAFTLAPPTLSNDVATTINVFITNNASAGAITTSGFTSVTGDDFSTIDGDDFLCSITVYDISGTEYSLLDVRAMQ